jgi:tRNA A-37 threonylcarbamoyl transferase component Bud32
MQAGESIGAYVVMRQLGSGGMGTVYLAEHAALGRRAAVKVLQPELTSNPEMVKRFFNEARAASAIKSPGIVEIYDFGYHGDGSAYLVMELLQGEALAARLQRLGRLPLGQALVIGRRIASALAPAHRAGIVHRDLKPDNVFLVLDEEVAGGERIKLLDFGIAKLLGDGEPGGAGKLTSTKTVMGSPHYMSPEQCRGAGGVDARSDLYALGCILFELISGQPPFTGEGAGDLIGAHIYLAPPSLVGAAPGVPPEVDALVQRLLAKDPAQRPPRAEDVAAALSELVARFGDPGQQQPSRNLAAVRAGTELPATIPVLGAAHPAVVGTPMAIERPPPGRAEGSKRSGLILALLALVGGVYAATRTNSETQNSTTELASSSFDAALAVVISTAAPEPSTSVEAPSIDAEPPRVGTTPAPTDAALPAGRNEVAISEQDLPRPRASASEGESTRSISASRRHSECTRLQRELKWSELKKCAAALQIAKDATPSEKIAGEIYSRRAIEESAAKLDFDKFQKAQRAGDMRAMGTLVERFDRTSLYWERVKTAWEARKAQFVAAEVKRATTAQARGQCEVVRSAARSIALYDTARGQALLDSCADDTSCDSPGTRRASDWLFEAIQGARVSSNVETIRLVEQALTDRCLSPKKSILLRIGIVAACAEKRADKVKFFYLKTKDPNLISACPDVLGEG